MTKRQEELSAAPPSSVSVPSSSSGSGSSNGSSGSIDSGEAPISFNFSLDEEWIVAKKVSEGGKSASRKSSIVRRVIFLSMVCPVLFGFRSFMAFKGATPPLHPLHALPGAVTPPQVRAGQIYFVTEWVPTLLILLTFWHRKGATARGQQQQRPSASPADAEELVAGSFDSTIMAPLMQQNVYPFTAAPPHPQAQGDMSHGPAMPSEVYPQFMHPQVPYRDSFSSYAPTASSGGFSHAQYAQQGQRQ
ncbi:hypothetical protein, conserved [Eimeria acervulina]|uniref:Uncharacterized protein n=1 Tax=Eimeria acervulina TaxID=5801 RepID=U6GP27_EIMAC|nr:hypothetical protein, conserved [Eimeria acervulina]CDI80369.1 hypothetical protein, conserved [Eimeria acervulina]